MLYEHTNNCLSTLSRTGLKLREIRLVKKKKKSSNKTQICKQYSRCHLWCYYVVTELTHIATKKKCKKIYVCYRTQLGFFKILNKLHKGNTNAFFTDTVLRYTVLHSKGKFVLNDI